MTQPDPTAAEAVQYWYDAAVERREERDQLRAVVARVRQMADAWEQQLPEVIRTPAVVSAIRAALEPAAVAPPADRAAAPAVWIDGHPQLEAIARAVWEQCGTDECAVVTIDDPRNIAVAALGALPATQPPADRTNLRDVAAQAIRDSNGSPEALAWWKAHPQLIPAHVYADAVLAVLPAPDNRATAPTAFVLWLDASDGSVPTHDGVCWPDGTATVHHRHFGYTTTHADPESARRDVHGAAQGRLVWLEPDNRGAVLLEAADIAESLRQFERTTGPRAAAQVSENVGILRVAEELRRLADEAQQDHGPRATLARVRDVLETEAVVGRSALEYRGLITAALLGRSAVAQQDPEPGGVRCGCPSEDAVEHQFGSEGCDCIPFTRQTNPPRYLNQPTDTVDMISGWERGRHCPHHPAAVARSRQPETSSEDDNPPVQCWHTEPDTPCDWDVCRQPERLAAGDRGTDPANEEPRP